MTFKIAKLELGKLFYSPVAWLLLIIFLIQCGLSYTDILRDYVTIQELGTYSSSMVFLTRKIFGFPFGILPGIVSKIYLYIPLLTMGLISREINSGTIRLLYSSPVKIKEIVFGKFLAMMIYDLMLVLVLGIVVGVGMFNIESADIGLLLSALLGLYLLLCAYSSIGLFMSCLTSYQVVAAISTLAMFALLDYIGTLWQGVDFVRDLTNFLSVSGRTIHMIKGLISTKDVLYFVIIMYIFLGLSIYKLSAARTPGSIIYKMAKYAFIVISAMIIGYIASRPGFIGYVDATATNTQTLTVNTQDILKEMDGHPLKVTSYINLLDGRFWRGRPRDRNADIARWEPYLRFKPDIELNYVYYYDSVPVKRLYKSNKGLDLKQLAEKYARSFKINFNRFKSPSEIRKVVDLRPEQNRYVMQLQYMGKSTFLRLFDDRHVFPGEAETAAAMKRLMVRPPKIAFLQGQFERSPDKMGDRDYKTLTSQITFRYALVNQGFDVEAVSTSDQEIPSDIGVLVIADPKINFDSQTLVKIQKYIEGGGNLLIAGEPDKQSVLDPVIRPLGVRFMEGELVQPSADFSPDLVLPYLTPAAAGFSKTVERVFEDSLPVSMPGVSGLSYVKNGEYDIKPLLVTDERRSWNKKGELAPDSAAVTYSAIEGDEKGRFPTALALTRQIGNEEQRIIVTGDADFLSNVELSRKQRNIKTCNFYFNTALFGWLTYGSFPIDVTRAKSRDNHLNITDRGVVLLKIVLLGVLPGLLLLFAAILMIRRKRK